MSRETGRVERQTTEQRADGHGCRVKGKSNVRSRRRGASTSKRIIRCLEVFGDLWQVMLTQNKSYAQSALELCLHRIAILLQLVQPPEKSPQTTVRRMHEG